MVDINSLLQKPLEKDDSWYVISSRWFHRYLRYLREGITTPGEIDQSDIVEPTNDNNRWKLKKGLTEEEDYFLVPEEVWTEMEDKYGGEDCIPIERKVIENNELFVEVYLVDVRVETEEGRYFEEEFSRTCFVREVKDMAKRYFDYSKCRFWLKSDTKGREVVDEDSTLEELSMQNLVFIIQKSNSWSEEVMPNLTKMYRSDSFDRAVDNYKPRPAGLVGLSNLGNTCFMNSALQCLSNTVPLTQYFLSDKYQSEVNRTNKLGMGGLVAEAYGGLIKEMWSGSTRVVSPRDFKYTISKFAPQFSGYRQHDSQELLAFLLDGLHEDLNRIIVKPYIEIKDSDGRDDLVVATEMWSIHKQRNDSVIVDLFQGLFKSTLVCPECNHVSITFDPFMFLSLPLPSESAVNISVTIVTLSKSFYKKSFQINKNGSIFDLKHEISLKTSIRKEDLVICDVFSHKIYQVLDDSKPIGSISPHDVIFAYEAPENTLFVWCLLKKMESHSSAHFGFPVLVSLQSAEISEEQFSGLLYKKISLLSLEKCNLELFRKEIKLEKVKDDTVICEMSSDLCNRLFGRNNEAFMLSEENNHVNINNRNVEKRISLYDCFELFTKEEKLGSSDPWYCPKCKKHQQATKKFDLWKLPNILVIHLKRFGYSRIFREKLDITVDFPVEMLDLSKKVIGPHEQAPIYDLFAVSCHFGGMGGGHYTALCRNINGNWYDFNDDCCTEVNKLRCDSSAYMLFYQLRK